jgi:hypothetical protein
VALGQQKSCMPKNLKEDAVNSTLAAILSWSFRCAVQVIAMTMEGMVKDTKVPKKAR